MLCQQISVLKRTACPKDFKLSNITLSRVLLFCMLVNVALIFYFILLHVSEILYADWSTAAFRHS